MDYSLVIVIGWTVLVLLNVLWWVKPQRTGPFLRQPEIMHVPTASWSFQNGRKLINGRPASASVTLQEYSSNGTTIYTAIKWPDNTASCNCPGWSNRKECKHSRKVLTMSQDSLINQPQTGSNSLPAAPKPQDHARKLDID
jgi:hypothetical protein